MIKMLYKLFETRDGSYVFGQRPNAPIIVWFMASVFSKIKFFESAKEALQLVALAALVFWALLEAAIGVNLFRRLLGSTVLLFTLLV